MNLSTILIYLFDFVAIGIIIYFLRKKIISKLVEVEERHVMNGLQKNKKSNPSEE